MKPLASSIQPIPRGRELTRQKVINRQNRNFRVLADGEQVAISGHEIRGFSNQGTDIGVYDDSHTLLAAPFTPDIMYHFIDFSQGHWLALGRLLDDVRHWRRNSL
jgi:hypothetical protein